MEKQNSCNRPQHNRDKALMMVVLVVMMAVVKIMVSTRIGGALILPALPP